VAAARDPPLLQGAAPCVDKNNAVTTSATVGATTRGIEGLVVADASVMPTIPRANTNVTVAAIAERLAETL